MGYTFFHGYHEFTTIPRFGEIMIWLCPFQWHWLWLGMSNSLHWDLSLSINDCPHHPTIKRPHLFKSPPSHPSTLHYVLSRSNVIILILLIRARHFPHSVSVNGDCNLQQYTYWEAFSFSVYPTLDGNN